MTGRGKTSLRGFTLLESLIGMFIFFLVLCGSLEFFGTSARVFSRLLGRQENRQAAWAALDRIRADIREAGSGLARPIRLGVLSGFEQTEGRWTLVAAEASPALGADATAGTATLSVSGTVGNWTGRSLCLCDGSNGETAVVLSAGDGSLTLTEPLHRSYRADEASLAVLRKTAFYLDADSHILRRKIDSSPAQPLLEDVQTFDLDTDSVNGLVRSRLSLISAPEEFYALKILARNAALGK
ncbi:MAG: PulJ/GspJ family protein [Candidatus Aminicenantales bacterium]